MQPSFREFTIGLLKRSVPGNQDGDRFEQLACVHLLVGTETEEKVAASMVILASCQIMLHLTTLYCMHHKGFHVIVGIVLY